MADATIEDRFDALRDNPVPGGNGPLDHFGRNPYGYDLGGEDGEGDGELRDFGDGAPGEHLARGALVEWAKCWQRYDVATAATVFHMEPGLISPLQIMPAEWEGQPPSTSHGFENLVQLVSSARSYSLGEPDFEFIQPTVAEVAALLNADEARVTEAVESHYWMFLGNQRDGSYEIDHEGE